MLRYAITDRTMFPGDEQERREALIRQAARLASNGVDYLQIREKDLPNEERLALAGALYEAIRRARGKTKVLLSGLPALALAASVDGVHLPSSLLHSALAEPGNVTGKRLIVSASCHSLDEVVLARGIADLILFAPVYGKRVVGELVTSGKGIESLREACVAAAPVPVLALGGVTEENAPECLRVGAAGFASIRAFVRAGLICR